MIKNSRAINSFGLNNALVSGFSCEISHEYYVLLIDGIVRMNRFVRLPLILFEPRPKLSL